MLWVKPKRTRQFTKKYETKTHQPGQDNQLNMYVPKQKQDGINVFKMVADKC